MAKLAFLVVVALCSFVLASCTSVKFRDCGSLKSKLFEVDLIPCPAQPCQLKKGTNVTAEVHFIPNEVITKATTIVYGIIAGVKVHFPIENPDACVDQGLTCPLKPGKEYTFKTMLPVKPEYPSLRLIAEWRLIDQDKLMVYCFDVPIEIVA